MAVKNLSASSLLTNVQRRNMWDNVSIYTPIAFDSIATVDVGSGGQSTIDFTDIPQGYKHLQLRADYTCSTSPGTLRFALGNGSIDTGANFTHHQLSGSGSSGSAWNSVGANYSYLFLESQQTYHWGVVMDIPDYSNTTKNKTVLTFTGGNNNGSGYIGYASTLWKSTSGITHLRLYTQSGNFEQYSKFALYGIVG